MFDDSPWPWLRVLPLVRLPPAHYHPETACADENRLSIQAHAVFQTEQF